MQNWDLCGIFGHLLAVALSRLSLVLGFFCPANPTAVFSSIP